MNLNRFADPSCFSFLSIPQSKIQQVAFDPQKFLDTIRTASQALPITSASFYGPIYEQIIEELEMYCALRSALASASKTPSDAFKRYNTETTRSLAQCQDRFQQIPQPELHSDKIITAFSLCAQALKRARDRFVETTPSFSEWQTMADILWPDLELLTVPERFIIEAPDPDTSTPLRDNHVRIVRALSEWMETHDANH